MAARRMSAITPQPYGDQEEEPEIEEEEESYAEPEAMCEEQQPENPADVEMAEESGGYRDDNVSEEDQARRVSEGTGTQHRQKKEESRRVTEGAKPTDRSPLQPLCLKLFTPPGNNPGNPGSTKSTQSVETQDSKGSSGSTAVPEVETEASIMEKRRKATEQHVIANVGLGKKPVKTAPIGAIRVLMPGMNTPEARNELGAILAKRKKDND